MEVISKNLNNSKVLAFSAKPIPQKTAIFLEKRLLKAKTVDIFIHSSPDEDAFNSAKVLYKWLEALGKKVRICADKKDLKGLFANTFERFKFKNNSKNADLTVCVDFNGLERISKKQKQLFNPKNLLVFDHHTLADTTFINKNNRYKNYIDDTAKSCCGVLLRFFDALKIKLKNSQLQNLYCGMLSDYKKSDYIKFAQNSDIIKTKNIQYDKNSQEVLNMIEQKLPKRFKKSVQNHLDILNNLSPLEANFKKGLSEKLKITENGKLAYLVIDYNDKTWSKLGMDNPRTEVILSDFRQNVLNPDLTKNVFSEMQKSKLKNVQATVVFYRKNSLPDSEYKMSLHSKNGYGFKLLDYIKQNYDKNLIAGGHPDRAGGKIFSSKNEDLQKFVQNFIDASNNV